MVNTSSVHILGVIPQNNNLNKETMANIFRCRVEKSKFVRVITYSFASQVAKSSLLLGKVDFFDIYRVNIKYKVVFRQYTEICKVTTVFRFLSRGQLTRVQLTNCVTYTKSVTAGICNP